MWKEESRVSCFGLLVGWFLIFLNLKRLKQNWNMLSKVNSRLQFLIVAFSMEYLVSEAVLGPIISCIVRHGFFMSLHSGQLDSHTSRCQANGQDHGIMGTDMF